ncbi:LOW QUALITY PROTEIN: large ribosomal subunit protein mL42 [Cottoperca gobio]|uniref:Large ribosomal subunit protein mL42 n=1 Tax=Cottoperca gobio TaxID=56716 RepID=A0A6J2S4A5_COTGO|nr:LOW QUALITY PROTEIN: 39S ribosomal protein L42, mitochondrial [Cottoperca gobio]
MASGHLCKLQSLLTRISYDTTLRHAQTCLVTMRQKSSGPSLEGHNCNVEIGVTSDGNTIVCYHPAVDVPYELTQPIDRPDPLTNSVESHDQILKAHLSKEVLKDKKGPTIEELSKMFFTTKHKWYPSGQYHMRRIKKDTPKDR